MKKRIIIFTLLLTGISFICYGFLNQNHSFTLASELNNNLKTSDKEAQKNKKDTLGFFYGIDTRFRPITKTDVDKATSIYDFISKEEAASVISYSSVQVIIIENDIQTNMREYGNNIALNEAQKKLIQPANYSTHFMVKAEYLNKNEETGQIEEHHFGPHFTVVPEKQTVYLKGEDALIKYLKDNSKDDVSLIEKDTFLMTKLYFTITTEGSISGVRLHRSTGYPSVDKKLIELITHAPGKWEPAKNSIGEKVNQELVFTFGIDGGC